MNLPKYQKEISLKNILGRIIVIITSSIGIFLFYQQLIPVMHLKPLSLVSAIGILTLFIALVGLISLCFILLNKIKLLQKYIEEHCDGPHIAFFKVNRNIL